MAAKCSGSNQALDQQGTITIRLMQLEVRKQDRYISDTLSQALTSEIEVIRLAGALVRDVQFEVGRRLLSRSAHPVAMDRSIAIVACELGLHNKTQ